jgi:hypothetical protein
MQKSSDNRQETYAEQEDRDDERQLELALESEGMPGG